MQIEIKGFQIEKFENMILKNDQIFTTKKANLQADTPEKHWRADTIALETEIDQLVYKLYGLTKEEIKIVEESVG